MGGISVIFVLILMLIIFALIVCALLMLAIVGVECFTSATVIAIVLAIKSKDIKKSGSKIWPKISIPIVLYMTSFSIFLLLIFIFSNIN